MSLIPEPDVALVACDRLSFIIHGTNTSCWSLSNWRLLNCVCSIAQTKIRMGPLGLTMRTSSFKVRQRQNYEIALHRHFYKEHAREQGIPKWHVSGVRGSKSGG